MAVRHALVKRPPEAVWAVLSDGSRYAEWVVGTRRTEEADQGWPEVGTAIRYEMRIGPVTLANRTEVRLCEPLRRLELEASAGRLGSARISLQLIPWGAAETLVVVDEHPLRGPSARLHGAPLELLLQWRHRRMLERLAGVVEAG
jgi:uncharacterized protein YndB with AHSA1/START domain